MTYEATYNLSIGDRVTVDLPKSERSGVVGHIAGFIGDRIRVLWPDGRAMLYTAYVVVVVPPNEVFNLHGAWRLIWNGAVPSTTWANKNGALAQLALLKSGYTTLCADGRLYHAGAAKVRAVAR